MSLSAEEFRNRLRSVLVRTGLSRRQMSAAMGRDPGYVASLLDPSRPSRARPTPDDLVRASDATGIPFIELLVELWGIEPTRLVEELDRLEAVGDVRALSAEDRAALADYVEFLASRTTNRDGAGRPTRR